MEGRVNSVKFIKLKIGKTLQIFRGSLFKLLNTGIIVNTRRGYAMTVHCALSVQVDALLQKLL